MTWQPSPMFVSSISSESDSDFIVCYFFDFCFINFCFYPYNFSSFLSCFPPLFLASQVAPAQ